MVRIGRIEGVLLLMSGVRTIKIYSCETFGKPWDEICNDGPTRPRYATVMPYIMKEGKEK